MTPKVVFIFRRDLRLQDNPAFTRAVKYCREINAQFMPCFFFTRNQITPRHNEYYSANAVAFLLECLEELDDDLHEAGFGHLHVFELTGEEPPAEAGPHLPFPHHDVKGVFFNRDTTPYALRRDATRPDDPTIGEGYLLLDSVHILKTGAGKPYQVFTPFYNKASIMNISNPTSAPRGALNHLPRNHDLPSLADLIKKYTPPSSHPVNKDMKGGRRAAMRQLEHVHGGGFSNYITTRDAPANERGTTRMSQYLKFGCISVREFYHSTHVKDLRRELFWREFYANVAFHFPRVLKGQLSAPNHYNSPLNEEPAWKHNNEHFARWSRGETGFPFVDAGMRQLNQTGFMHNRLRMVVAMFLTKDLHIDWRWGEQYFAQKLTDYDPAQNSGGWQWSSSTGADAQPYFRIFNPYEQGKRYDPDAVYIKRWVPELTPVQPRDIHRWDEKNTQYKTVDYPPPMVVHSKEAEQTLLTFKKNQGAA